MCEGVFMWFRCACILMTIVIYCKMSTAKKCKVNGMILNVFNFGNGSWFQPAPTPLWYFGSFTPWWQRVLAAVITRRVQEVIAGPRATTGKLNSHYINLETSAKLKRRAVKLSGNTREWCSLKELSGHIPGSRAGKDVVPGAAPLCPDCMHPAECTQALLQH